MPVSFVCVGQSFFVKCAANRVVHLSDLFFSPSSAVCIRGFLCHVMVSWLWEAFCSATLQPVHLFCQAWNPAVPRRTKWVWEIPSAGICTLGEHNCFAYSSIEQIPLVQSLCIFLCEEFKAGKQVLFSKADCGVTKFYCRSVYLSVCLCFLI